MAGTRDPSLGLLNSNDGFATLAARSGIRWRKTKARPQPRPMFPAGPMSYTSLDATLFSHWTNGAPEKAFPPPSRR